MGEIFHRLIKLFFSSQSLLALLAIITGVVISAILLTVVLPAVRGIIKYAKHLFLKKIYYKNNKRIINRHRDYLDNYGHFHYITIKNDQVSISIYVSNKINTISRYIGRPLCYVQFALFPVIEGDMSDADFNRYCSAIYDCSFTTLTYPIMNGIPRSILGAIMASAIDQMVGDFPVHYSPITHREMSKLISYPSEEFSKNTLPHILNEFKKILGICGGGYKIELPHKNTPFLDGLSIMFNGDLYEIDSKSNDGFIPVLSGITNNMDESNIPIM